MTTAADSTAREAASTGAASGGAPAVNRKARVGTVVSDKGDQTIIVAIERAAPHRLYRKVIRRTKRYPVHDPANSATVGDLVRIEECRPISKTKRWRLVEVLTEREVAEVAPTALDADLVSEVQRSAAHAAGQTGGGAAMATNEGEHDAADLVREAEDDPGGTPDEERDDPSAVEIAEHQSAQETTAHDPSNTRIVEEPRGGALDEERLHPEQQLVEELGPEAAGEDAAEGDGGR